MATVQFVDKIDASPTVRLDLNSRTSGLMVAADGIDLSPPPLRRSLSSTMLVDGERVAAAAYGNRTLKVPLKVIAGSGDAAATALQNLARQLNRPANVLRYQPDTSAPVFFRTLRAPDYTLAMLRLLLAERTQATLEIPAEPFGYGLRVDQAAAVVSNDPATGCYLDVTGVTGDVETPAYIHTTTDLRGKTALLAAYHGDTALSGVEVRQAESFTASTDTAVQANDAAMSGSGSNYMRTTFATNAALNVRLYTASALPAVPIGQYRAFVRVRKTVTTDVFTLRLGQYVSGSAVVFGDTITYGSVGSVGPHWLDLGLFQHPFGAVLGENGLTGTLIGSPGLNLSLAAGRTSGTGSLDWDCLLLVPADWSQSTTKVDSGVLTAPVIAWDGPNDAVRQLTASPFASPSYIAAARPIVRTGGLPYLVPGGTNRLFLLQQVGTDTADVLANTTSVAVSWWPRYLHVRPATT